MQTNYPYSEVISMSVDNVRVAEDVLFLYIVLETTRYM